MLFGVGSNQREEACLDYSNVVPLHSELVLLLRDSMTGAVRYKVERHRDDVSEQYVRQRMARFRDEGQGRPADPGRPQASNAHARPSSPVPLSVDHALDPRVVLLGLHVRDGLRPASHL
jgi:hypothetical protein